MSAERFLASVVCGVADALDPLVVAVESPEQREVLLAELGWTLDLRARAALQQSLGPLPTLGTELSRAVGAFRRLPPDADTLAVARALGDLAAAITEFAGALRELAPVDGAPPPPLNDPVFWRSVSDEVLDLLVTQRLARAQPRLLSALRLAGIVTVQQVPDAEGRAAFEWRRIHWDRLSTLATDPGRLFKEVYGWGGALKSAASDDASDVDAGASLILALADAIGGFGVPVDVSGGLVELVDAYWKPDAEMRERILRLDAPLMRRVISADGGAGLLSVGLSVMPIPPHAEAGQSVAAPVGLSVAPFVTGSASAEIPFGSGLKLAIGGGFESDGAIRLELRPEACDIATSLQGEVDAHLQLIAKPSEPWVLIGSRDSTRVELASAHVGLTARVGTKGPPEIAIEVAADDMSLVVDFGSGDGFLTTLLGAEPQRVDFAAGLAWSNQDGFRFIGQATLEVTLSIKQSIAGVLDIDSLDIALGVPEPGRVGLTLAVSGGLNLGPVHAVVEKVGLQAAIEDRSSGAPGNLGAADLGFAFKPPTGLALSIDSGAVTGGGFLFFDPAQEQYAGGLFLEFESITLTAFGLLTTRLPDGAPGFSLLVIVQASGFTPIQLGFGFTLNGVGGLLGINRTVAVDVLRAGVLDRTLDAVMFQQEDPTPRAAEIVRTLQRVFPPARDRLVFGPMAKLGWGTPTLITLELGLVLELPLPVRLIILGRLRMTLPRPELAVVRINLDAVGVIDFGQREASLDASLFDSFIGPFALTGDMAARMGWGENAQLALSIGGFHPSFTPPAGFPALRRLAVSLSTGNNPRLRMEGYLALTSNTVQVGARLDLYVKAGPFSLEGGLGFDALLQLSPFAFVVDIFAYLTIKRGSTTLLGLDVRVHLSGPSPWEARGEVTLKILFFKVTVSFQARFGRADEIPPPPRTAVWDLLKPALELPGNWSAQLPAAESRLAVLRAEPPDEKAVLVHPLGIVAVTQRVAPLERNLTRFGAAPPSDFARFGITGANGADKVGATYERLAPAQFAEMSDAEKLSRPSFESMVAGAQLGPPEDAAAVGYEQELPLTYETKLTVGDEPAVPLAGVHTAGENGIAAGADVGPAAMAETRAQGRAQFAVADEALARPRAAVGDPDYVVSYRDRLEQIEVAGVDGTYGAATDALRRHETVNPELRGRLQVVLRHEVEAVAA